jgi:hypothetical protein
MSDVLSRLVARARRSDLCLGRRPQFRFAAPPSLLPGAAWPQGAGDPLAEALQMPSGAGAQSAAPADSPWADAATDPFVADAGPPVPDTPTAAPRMMTVAAADPFGAAPGPPAADRQTGTTGHDADIASSAALPAPSGRTLANPRRVAGPTAPDILAPSLTLRQDAWQPQGNAVAMVTTATPATTTGSAPEAPQAAMQVTTRADGARSVPSLPAAQLPLRPSSPSAAKPIGAGPLSQIDGGSQPAVTLPDTAVAQPPAAVAAQPGTMQRQADAILSSSTVAAAPVAGPAIAPPRPPGGRAVAGTGSPGEAAWREVRTPPPLLAPAPPAESSQAGREGPSAATDPLPDSPTRRAVQAAQRQPSGISEGGMVASSKAAPLADAVAAPGPTPPAFDATVPRRPLAAATPLPGLIAPLADAVAAPRPTPPAIDATVPRRPLPAATPSHGLIRRIDVEPTHEPEAGPDPDPRRPNAGERADSNSLPLVRAAAPVVASARPAPVATAEPALLQHHGDTPPDRAAFRQRPAAEPAPPRHEAALPAVRPALPLAATPARPPAIPAAVPDRDLGAMPGRQVVAGRDRTSAPPSPLRQAMPRGQGDVMQRVAAPPRAAPTQQAQVSRRVPDAPAPEQGPDDGRAAPSTTGSAAVLRQLGPGPAMSTPRAETGNRSPPMASPGPIQIDIGRIQVTMPARAQPAPARPQAPAPKAKPRGGPDI